MPEAELGGARQHGRLARNHELLDPQPAQRVADNGRAAPGEVGDQRVPEDPADDGGVLGRALLRRWQRVEAGRQHRLDRARDLDILEAAGELPLAVGEADDAPVDEHPHELLGEQRIAAGQRDDPIAHLVREVPVKQPVEHPRVLVRR